MSALGEGTRGRFVPVGGAAAGLCDGSGTLTGGLLSRRDDECATGGSFRRGLWLMGFVDKSTLPRRVSKTVPVDFRLFGLCHADCAFVLLGFRVRSSSCVYIRPDFGRSKLADWVGDVSMDDVPQVICALPRVAVV